jgi:hypothetical protein
MHGNDRNPDPGERPVANTGSEAGGDTGGVVEGPVGSASLKEPADAAPSAADLDALPAIDADDGSPVDRS